MATKNKIGLQFEGFEDLIKELEELDGDLKATTEKALIESKKIVTNELESAMVNSNLPAKGKYSTGRTKKSIDTKTDVEWEGTTATIHIGFNISEGGLTSIFLMYGTPRMKKSPQIYKAVYGSKTKKKVAEVQRKVFEKAIEEKMR